MISPKSSDFLWPLPILAALRMSFCFGEELVLLFVLIEVLGLNKLQYFARVRYCPLGRIYGQQAFWRLSDSSTPVDLLGIASVKL